MARRPAGDVEGVLSRDADSGWDGTQAAHEATPLAEQFNELRDTWQASVAKWTEFAKEAAQGEMPSVDKLREMFAPAAWARGRSGLGRPRRGAAAGAGRPALRRALGPGPQLLELQKLTLQRDKAVAAYQAVVQKGVEPRLPALHEGAGFEAASRRRADLARTDRQWLAVANDTLIEVHRSDEFIEAQRRMLRAASDRHLQERKIAEAWCEAVARADAQRSRRASAPVVELRREVRLLRRATPAARRTGVGRSGSQGPARRPRAAGKRARS